jgi:hypothetical protein
MRLNDPHFTNPDLGPAPKVVRMIPADEVVPPTAEELAELGRRIDMARRPAGNCLDCGREVRADRKGALWTTDPNDGLPLWCYSPALPLGDRPSKDHRLAAECAADTGDGEADDVTYTL